MPMFRRRNPVERHFTIGAVHATVRTRLSHAMRHFTDMYGEFETDAAIPGAIQLEIDRPRRKWLSRRRYRIHVNGTVQFEPEKRVELVPYMEWGLNWQVPRTMPDYLQFHASSLEVDGQGVILPGHSGSGKSTLATGLVKRGWNYLCDEFALVHVKRMQLDAYPRAICLKKAAFDAIESIGVTLDRRKHFVKRTKGDVTFISPTQIRPNAVGVSCPVRFVVFPTYKAGAASELMPMTRAQAAFALHRVCFNLFECHRLGLDVIADVVRDARCYRLTSGDLSSTCALLEQVVSAAPSEVIRCA